MSVGSGPYFEKSHYELEHRFRPVRSPEHPSTLKLIDYWKSCEAQGGMRMGRDIPARPLARLLRDLTVSEPIGDWEDARVRLAGSGMTEHFGREVSGLLNSEIFAGSAEDKQMMLAGARNVIARRRPGTVEHTLFDGERAVLRQEMTALPLLSPDGSAYWILIGTFNF
jgi:hypothetical protein